MSEHPDEDTDLDSCKAAIRRLEKMEKDVEVACARGKIMWTLNCQFNCITGNRAYYKICIDHGAAGTSTSSAQTLGN